MQVRCSGGREEQGTNTVESYEQCTGKLPKVLEAYYLVTEFCLILKLNLDFVNNVHICKTSDLGRPVAQIAAV